MHTTEPYVSSAEASEWVPIHTDADGVLALAARSGTESTDGSPRAGPLASMLKDKSIVRRVKNWKVVGSLSRRPSRVCPDSANPTKPLTWGGSKA
jgi:hypothetical protein